MEKNRELHYRYIISYLIIAIILIVSLFYNHVSGLFDKLSFALTLSSLLLAILAIFYTIIAANRQDEQLTRLLATNHDIDKAAQEIAKTSQEVRSTITTIPSHLQSMGSKIDNLSMQYQKVPSEKTSESKGFLSIDEKTFFEMFKQLQFDAMGVLYLFTAAHMQNEPIPWNVFDQLKISNPYYAIGVLNGLETTGLIDFKIHEGAIISIKCEDVVIRSIKRALESVIKVVSELKASELKGMMSVVDQKYKKS